MGYTQKTETWNMSSSQKTAVTFNRFGKPVGDEGNEVVQYLGTLVRMTNHVGIDNDDWRKIPIQIKEDMYSMVKASLEAIERDSSSTLGSVDDFSNDDYSKVKGLEKKGYIRCVGRMSNVKKKVVSCSTGPSVEQLKTMVKVMVNIIQEHIPNANLSRILSNMNIQMPCITSTIQRNSNSVNRRSSLKVIIMMVIIS
ncbi:unnamed protein product [Lactuca virosa]|uniref:Uncharacterized protein n=1 Tax=Lactuca virosa TaxID=75947 RepID=A0AAU9M2Q2_9ASTR|nr:unnamed protein product [Lactuca virosa]